VKLTEEREIAAASASTLARRGGGSPVSYLVQRVTGGRASLRALEPREKWCRVRKGGDDGAWAFLKPTWRHWDRGGQLLTHWPEAAVWGGAV
jgi:hypothetical protein